MSKFGENTSRRQVRSRGIAAWCSVILLVAISSTGASAGSIVYTQTVNFPLPANTDSFAGVPQTGFPGWIASEHPGKIPTHIELAHTATLQGMITAENQTSSTGSLSVDFNVGFLINAWLFGNTSSSVNLNAGPVAVGPTDGVSGSGSDFVNFGLLSGTSSSSAQKAAGSLNVDEFGNISGTSVYVNIFGGLAPSGVSKASASANNASAMVVVSLTYFYVPEPRTEVIALFGLPLVTAFVALVQRGNRRKLPRASKSC